MWGARPTIELSRQQFTPLIQYPVHACSVSLKRTVVWQSMIFLSHCFISSRTTNKIVEILGFLVGFSGVREYARRFHQICLLLKTAKALSNLDGIRGISCNIYFYQSHIKSSLRMHSQYAKVWKKNTRIPNSTIMKKTCLCYCPFTGSFEQNFLIRNLIWQLALGEPMHLGELCVFTDSLVTLGRLQHFPFSHNWTHICFECFFSQEITARFRILFFENVFL